MNVAGIGELRNVYIMCGETIRQEKTTREILYTVDKRVVMLI
jgi:hypothetical protein